MVIDVDWRAQLRAELALGGGLERLTELERVSIEQGRSFEAIFDGANNVQPLPWRLPSGKCEIGYADGDRNPWCRCTATIPAQAEAVLESIWEIDGEAMRYHERAAFQVLGRPSAHRVNLSLKARIVPMMPILTWPLSATWVSSTTAGGEKDFIIVFLQAATGAVSDGQAIASTLQLVVLKPGQHAGESHITYLFQVNVGGYIDALERLLPNARIKLVRMQRELIACIHRYHRQTFWRSQLRAELALGGRLERLTEPERASIEEGRSFEAIFDGANVQPLPWRLPGATCEIAYADGDPNLWCRCTITLPATAETVLEAIWEINSEPMRYHERVEFDVVDRPTAHRVSWLGRVRIVPTLPKFELSSTGTWAKFGAPGETQYAIALLPLLSPSNRADHSVDPNIGSAKASMLQLCLLKPGARANTTIFTYLFQVNLGLHVRVLERFLPNVRIEAIRRHRALVASFKWHFAGQVQAWLNDAEDDCAWRDALVDEIRQGGHSYSEAETALIAKGAAQLDAFGTSKGKARSLKHSKTVDVAQLIHDKKTGRLVGNVECRIRALPEEIVAYLMHFEREIRKSQLSTEVVRHKMLEAKSSHHAVVLSETKAGPNLPNLASMNAVLWQKVADAPLTYIWVAVPIKDHPAVPSEDAARVVRVEVTSCIRLTFDEDDNVTKVQLVCSAGREERLAMLEMMELPQSMLKYFMQVEPPSEFTAADGAILGHLLMDLVETTKLPVRATAIRMFVERTALLRECSFAHLDAFIGGIFEERLLFTLGLGFRKFKTVSVPEVVATIPAMVTAGGAALMGKGLESIVRMSATPAEAIDELIGKYPALKVMGDQHVWFRPLLEAIAKRRVASAPLGLKARLVLGAGLSILDMVSDIINIRALFLAGRSTDASVLLGMIALNLAVQALVVTLQNWHRGARAVLRELGVVCSLLKPGVDAARVAGGAERVEGAPLNPLDEMIICKIIEMTFESIPGGLAQAIFLLNGGDWTTAAVVSVSLSCVSTAFIASTLVYDFDTDPMKRKRNPEFYGFIPDTIGKRALVFALLFLYHTAWSLGKTFSMAVLAETNWLWLVVYLLSDHCGLILYKLACGDLIYWVPGLGWALSMLARIIAKVVMDFTGYAVRLCPTTGLAFYLCHARLTLLCCSCIQCRHPFELGGIYFFVNALMNVLSWLVAAALYSLYYPAGPAEPAHVSMVNFSANVTGANSAGALSAFACNRTDVLTPCYLQRRRCQHAR